MDEEMEEYMMEAFMAEQFVFDFDYEFDAPQCYDFTRPETVAEAREAERWFDSATSYPPSPFIVKLNWRYDAIGEIGSVSCISSEGGSTSSVSNDYEASAMDDNNRGLESCNQMDKDIPKSKNMSLVKPSLSRSSTLMKPTASYLAKHSQLQEVYSNKILRRSKTLIGKVDKCFQSSYIIENLATKRQKLDAGFLRKVSHLKHQAVFLHKVPYSIGSLDINSMHARPRVTIPREPNLETAHRAERNRSKISAESVEYAKSRACSFKARPLNRKILDSAPSTLPKKNTLPPTECQEFQLRTSERARQHACNHGGAMCNFNSISHNETKDSIRLNSDNALKEEKCEAVQKVKSHPSDKKIFTNKGEFGVFQNAKQDCISPMHKKFLNEPPIELFSKLSLASEVQNNIKAQSKMPLPTKGSKENTPGSLHLESEMLKLVKENSQRFGRNHGQCGSESTYTRINEVGPRFNVNRNLDIR